MERTELIEPLRELVLVPFLMLLLPWETEFVPFVIGEFLFNVVLVFVWVLFKNGMLINVDVATLLEILVGAAITVVTVERIV